MSKTTDSIKECFNKGYRVFSGIVFYNGRVVKTSVHKSGYRYFSIRLFSKERTTIQVHRLVAYQKFGDIIEQHNLEVRHLDNNSFNNKEENIDIGTTSENKLDHAPPLRKAIAKHAASFLIKYNADEIKKEKANGLTYLQLMEKFNIPSLGTVSHIINKR